MGSGIRAGGAPLSRQTRRPAAKDSAPRRVTHSGGRGCALAGSGNTTGGESKPDSK